MNTAQHTRVSVARGVAIASIATLVATLFAPAASAEPITSVEAPSIVTANAKATITVRTSNGDNDTATLWTRSASDGAWVPTSTEFTIVDGVGKRQVTVTASRTYRVQTSGGDISKSFAISARDSAGRAIVAKFTAATVASGELAWIRGTAYKGTAKLEGASVAIERAANGSSSWKTIGYATTNQTYGTFTYRINASTSYRYRAVVRGTYARSAPFTVSAGSGDRTLESRHSAVAAFAGSAGSIHNVSSSDLPSGVSSARYRTYSKGTLIEVHRSSGVRTWFVYDRIGSKWSSLGKFDSRLRLPMRDAKCGLLEGGCVQRFTGGAIYQNNNKSGAFVAYTAAPESELIATALSQANYEEPSWRVNKFNAWVGDDNAWCSVFLSWVGAASGNPTWVPKRASYSSFVSALEASGELHYSGTPPTGAIVLFDWQTGNPTHSGLVRGHSSGSIYTVEGNTSDGTGDPQRGVWLRSRHTADVWAWYIPHELPN